MEVETNESINIPGATANEFEHAVMQKHKAQGSRNRAQEVTSKMTDSG